MSADPGVLAGLDGLRQVRAKPVVWSYGRSAPPETPEDFQPVRWVSSAQKCHWCFGRIPPGKPGATTGTRGTKAFLCVRVGLWRHIDCHNEARAQEAA